MSLHPRLLTDVLVGKPITAYDEVGAQRKQQFHRDARRFLRALAVDLGLQKHDYDLRSNEGGMAVSGEVTLHADCLYIQLSKGPFADVLYRRCESRQDYYGGANHQLHLVDFTNPCALRTFVASCKELMRSDHGSTPLSFAWHGLTVRPQFGLHSRTRAISLHAIVDGDQIVGGSPYADGMWVSQLSASGDLFPPRELGMDVIAISSHNMASGVVTMLADAGMVEPNVLATYDTGYTQLYAFRLTPAARQMCDLHSASLQRVAA